MRTPSNIITRLHTLLVQLYLDFVKYFTNATAMQVRSEILIKCLILHTIGVFSIFFFSIFHNTSCVTVYNAVIKIDVYVDKLSLLYLMDL